MPPRSPLAAFLGFDPERDEDCAILEDEREPLPPLPEPVRLVEVAPVVVAVADQGQLEAMTLAKAVQANPRAVLLLALKAIFEAAVPVRPATHLPGGRYGAARTATCWALRELAALYAQETAASGWIVGKRDNPHL